MASTFLQEWTEVALALSHYMRLFYAPAIFAEYTEVLKRPKFHLDPKAVDVLLQEFTAAATIVHPTSRISAALDEGDNWFLECEQEGNLA